MATEKVKQAAENPLVEVRDGLVWLALRQEDIQTAEQLRNGIPTGQRTLKFAKTYTATDLKEEKSFPVVGENGDVGGTFGGVFQGLTVNLKLQNAHVQEEKAKANMMLNFNKLLRIRTLLTTKKKVNGEDVPIEVKERDRLFLKDLQEWAHFEGGRRLLGHTYAEMLQADETHSNEAKRGKWLEGFLKIMRELGQSTERTQLEHLAQLAKDGASNEEIAKVAEEALRQLGEQEVAKATKKARLVKASPKEER